MQSITDTTLNTSTGSVLLPPPVKRVTGAQLKDFCPRTVARDFVDLFAIGRTLFLPLPAPARKAGCFVFLLICLYPWFIHFLRCQVLVAWL
jgi:hypothetical protein